MKISDCCGDTICSRKDKTEKTQGDFTYVLRTRGRETKPCKIQPEATLQPCSLKVKKLINQ